MDNLMLVAVWITQESSPEHPMTSSKAVKLQTRAIHQIEATIFIALFKDNPNSNLEIFSTAAFQTQNLHL